MSKRKYKSIWDIDLDNQREVEKFHNKRLSNSVGLFIQRKSIDREFKPRNPIAWEFLLIISVAIIAICGAIFFVVSAYPLLTTVGLEMSNLTVPHIDPLSVVYELPQQIDLTYLIYVLVAVIFLYFAYKLFRGDHYTSSHISSPESSTTQNTSTTPYRDTWYNGDVQWIYDENGAHPTTDQPRIEKRERSSRLMNQSLGRIGHTITVNYYGTTYKGKLLHVNEQGIFVEGAGSWFTYDAIRDITF